MRLVERHLDAELLGFHYGSHKSQSFLEALAIFLALREWGALLASIKVGLAIRSTPWWHGDGLAIGEVAGRRDHPHPRAGKNQRVGGLAVSASDPGSDAKPAPRGQDDQTQAIFPWA